MLSKVVKSADARQIQAMAFAGAVAAEWQLRHATPPGREPAVKEDQSHLLEKIRALETSMAGVQRDAFEAGRKQGGQEARAEFAPVIARMNASIAEVTGMRPELRRQAEKDAVDLSLRIARRVLHRELTVDANALNALVRVVFDRLARSESWRLTVHPQFADAIRGALPAASRDNIRIEIDPNCEPGTLVVRSAEGVIDASIDSQLAEISSGLMDRLNHK